MTVAETSRRFDAPGAPAGSPWHNRPLSLAVLAVTLSVLGTAAWLEADPSGVGTHQRLGLPACGLLNQTGWPCATCGMTTAFTHAAHGQFLSALRAQPAGAVFAVVTAAFALLSAYCLMMGMSMAPIFAWVWRVPVVIGFIAIVLIGWIYKILVVQGNL